MEALRRSAGAKQRVAVLLGGTSFERHISVESGRNVYEKLSSSETYRPLPLFLTAPVTDDQSGNPYVLYQLPVNLLLKDNADDIRDKIRKPQEHPAIAEIRRACAAITGPLRRSRRRLSPRARIPGGTAPHGRRRIHCPARPAGGGRTGTARTRTTGPYPIMAQGRRARPSPSTSTPPYSASTPPAYP